MTQSPSQYGAPAGRPDPARDFDDDARYVDTAATGSGSSASDTAKDQAGQVADTGAQAAKDVAGTAKDQAGQVADTGVQAAKDVAGTAKDEVATVVAETKQQAKSLFESTRTELQSQGAAQQQRLATSLHSLSQELGGMASGSDQSGPLTDLAKQLAGKGGEVAHWLETHEPADVLQQVQGFARRRPVAFLALCGLAGLVAGRIARAAASSDDSSPSDATGGRTTGRLADTDGAGLGYSDLLDSNPATQAPAGQAGTRYDVPGSGFGVRDIGTAQYDDTLDRPGEAR